jgi:outer membrane protein assembly factor BamA
VDEGAQYQMGDLDLTGVDEKTKAKLQETWSLKPGQPYDAAYVRTFLKNTNVLLPGDAWTISVHEAINDSDKTVDVTLKFTPKA